MKVRYIILKQPLQVPGCGSSKKWTANGQDGNYVNAVKTITETTEGVTFRLTVGAHRGEYLIPWHEIAMVSYADEPGDKRFDYVARAIDEAKRLNAAAGTKSDATVANSKPQKRRTTPSA